MLVTLPSVFHRRTQNSYTAHRKRARADRQELGFSKAGHPTASSTLEGRVNRASCEEAGAGLSNYQYLGTPAPSSAGKNGVCLAFACTGAQPSAHRSSKSRSPSRPSRASRRAAMARRPR